MTFPRLSLSPIFATLCLAVAMPLQAATVVSNLANDPGTPAHEGSFVVPAVPYNLYDNEVLATSFTTGSAGVIVDSVTLSMAGGGSGTGFPVYISNDDAGLPAPFLSFPPQSFSLSGEQSPTTAGLYDYVPNSLLTLAANTRYWLVSGQANYNPANPNFFINTTADTTVASPDGWTIGDQVLHSFGYLNPWSVQSDNTALQFSINATAVPEPTRGMLLLMAVAAGVLRRRRTRVAA